MPEIKERLVVTYANLSTVFSDIKRDYSKQYCSIYTVRLEQMRHIFLERIQNKWGGEYNVCKLHELTEENGDKCVVVCNLFKDQKLKPSLLKQLAEANHLMPQPILDHFTDESDILYIEDELQRYQVTGVLKGEDLVTGVTCAVLGTNVGKGKFLVEDYIFAGCREQIERPILADDTYVILVSGLDFLQVNKSLMNLQLLVHWISGVVDTEQAAKIVRVIIAGNSVKTCQVRTQQQTISLTSRVAESSETIDAVKLFDTWLLQLCQVVDVDVMPGEFDPSNHILPQQSMHHCMFPNSSVYKSLNHVSNPYFCSVGGVKIMGTSGQPVHDIMRYSEIQEPINALENCLNWNHLAPTAPDTLGCYPFYDKDVFIIDDCPHVLFAGNQNKFDTRVMTGKKKFRVVSLYIMCSTIIAVLGACAYWKVGRFLGYTELITENELTTVSTEH